MISEYKQETNKENRVVYEFNLNQLTTNVIITFKPVNRFAEPIN